MVNRLMVLRRHYSEIADDFLRTMNLPNTREIDTMQERLQQVRRENFALKKDIKEIKAMLAQINTKTDAGSEESTRSQGGAQDQESTRGQSCASPQESCG